MVGCTENIINTVEHFNDQAITPHLYILCWPLAAELLDWN